MTANLDRHLVALATDPGDQNAFGALEEAYFVCAKWDELVALYEQRLDGPGLEDPRERAPLHYRLGQILEERRLDIDLAIEQYTQAVQIDPGYLPALRQLRQVHASREAWDLVLQIAEVEIETLREPYERAAFFAEMGDVWLQHIQDTNEAMSCFEQALAIDPMQKAALAGMARTLAARGNAEAAAATWERLIGCIRGPDRAAPLVSLAALLSGPLRQGERAVELYRRALSDDPRNEAAVEALSVSASARGQWDLLADLYDRRFSLAAGARRRTAIALEAGYMQLEQMENLDAARIWFERAEEMSGDDLTVLASFVDLEREGGDDDALASALERLIQTTGREAPLRYLLEAAGLHTERADDERALVCLERAEQQAPNDALVLESLGAAYASLLRHDELAAILERRAALAEDDPEARAGALIELGYVQVTQLGDARAAQDAYERAFTACPTHAGLASTLEALYRKTESWEPLRVLLERAAETGPAEERGAFYCSLGELLEQQLGDPEASTGYYEACLDLGPNPRALQGLSRIAAASGDPRAMLRALEREASASADPERLVTVSLDLCARYAQTGDLDGALGWAERALGTAPDSRECLEANARLQEQLGREDELTRTLSHLEEVLDGPEQTAIRRRLAALCASRGDDDGAVTWWMRVLELDPDDLDGLKALRQSYTTRSRWEDLAPVLRRLADRAPQPEQASYLDELCTLLDEQLCDLDGAIVVLWRLTNTPGRHQDVSTRLENLLERAGRFEELAQQLLERRRALPDDSEDAIDIDLRRAQLLLDPLGQFEEAANAFRAVRMQAPEREEATGGLERALRAANDSAGLAQLLEEIASTTSDPERRDQLSFERAVLLEESLGELEQARQAYTNLSSDETTPTIATQASTRLESLLERCGDWAALRARLEAATLNAPPADQRILHERIARLCADRMGDPQGVATHLEAAARIEPGRPDPWRTLASLYQELDRPDDLLRVTQAELATGPDSERERLLHARAAELWTKRPGEEDRACEHFERLLELEPGRSDASEFLIDRYESQEQFRDVVRLLEGRLTAVSPAEGTPAEVDPNRGLATSLRLRIATLRAEELDDPEGAIDFLEPALADGGPTGPVAEPLADLFEATGRNDDLIRLCGAAAEACREPSLRSEWLRRLAGCLRASGQDDQAISAYRQLLDDRPRDAEAYAALCDLYRHGGRAAPLAELLESSLTYTPGAEEASVRMELARLLEEELARPLDALPHLQRVIELEGDHEAAFRHALGLARQLQRHDEEMRLVNTRLGRRLPLEEQVELLERRADLLAGPIAAPEAAVSAYREVIALAPKRRSARRSLREVLEGLGRWTAVLDCLYIDAEGADPEERAGIYERAVEIACVQIGQDAALPWLERLRSVRRDDPLIIARIADVHRMAGRFESVLRALEDELALTTDLERKRELHVGRSRILERDMQAPGRAITALEAARNLSPKDPDILSKLDALYDVTGRAKERAEIIEARLPDCDEHERVPLHLAAADLYSGPLADPEPAIPHLLRAVSLTRALSGGAGDLGADRDDGPVSTPEARAALLADLALTLRAAGREEAWARAAEAELDVLRMQLADGPADDPRFARRNILHRDLAWSYADSLANQRTALAHLRTLMTLCDERPCKGECEDPLEDRQAHEDRVEGLTREDIDRVECRLLDLLRQDANWIELEERLATRVARGNGLADEWLELARLRDERLHAPRAALDAYVQSLSLRPGSLPAIRGLRDLSERLADWPEMTRALELELALPDRWSPRERAALSRRLGEICWRRLDVPERAMRAYGDALDADPGDLEALRALQELHHAQADFEQAATLYEREADILGEAEPDRRKQVWLAAAELAHQHMSDPRRALRAYEAAAALSRLDPGQLRAQADLYEQVGDREKFAAVHADWCDDPDADATSAEHLSLVEVLVQLGRADHALARCRTAIEVDGDNADAWTTLARLHGDRGNANDAADAWERAGELRMGPEAADHLCDAALLVEATDLANCARRLRRAVELDSASASTQAHLARVACALESWEEAETAAARSLDLVAARGDGLHDDPVLLDTALAGGRAARARDRLESAVLFYGVALDLDDSNREALEAYGELLFERGDLAAARGALEARLELEANDRHAERLTMLGSVLELAGEEAEALERFRAAVRADETCGAGHAGVARLCEKAGRIDEAVAALEGWADAARTAGNPVDCGARLLRAAELELGHERTDAAEAHLRDSLEACPNNARSWVLLAEIHAEADRVDELLRLAPEALSQSEIAESPDAVARLSLLYAQALERRGDAVTACDAYDAAVRHDTRCAEAALSKARLLRGRGDWQAAADSLQDFCERHPEPDHRDLAEAHYKRARLLSGPLEDMQGAMRCFERALEIAPDHPKAREPLASLLAVMPDRWDEAIVHHRLLLAEDPTRAGSFRALLQIAKGRENAESVRFGLAVLRAMGAASPLERSEAPDSLPAPVVADPGLIDPAEESARRLVQQASEALSQVLQTQTREPAAAGDFTTRMGDAASELSAAGLEGLSDQELGDLLSTLAVLALGDDVAESNHDGVLDADLTGRLDHALGRWTRRKMRRILDGVSTDSIHAIDPKHWRTAMRGLAAAVAVDRGHGDLRHALTQLSNPSDSGDSTRAPSAADADDLSAKIGASPDARELLRRVAARWCQELVES